MIKIVGRVPLQKTSFRHHTDFVTHCKSIILVMRHQDTGGLVRFEHIGHLLP